MNSVSAVQPVYLILSAGYLMLTGSHAFSVELPVSPSTEEIPVILAQEPLAIPFDLRHVTHAWDDGRILVRVNPNGLVEDWIPLELPHRKLVKALDRCVSSMKFQPSTMEGNPVNCDVRIDVPLRGAGGYGVVSQTIAEHLESMQVSMGWNHDKLFLSTPGQLDFPLDLIDKGRPFLAVDESGKLLSGTVYVDFYIDMDGKPRMWRVIDSPNPVMARAACMTVSGFRFSPPTQKGEPTMVKVRIPIVLASN